MNDTSGPAVKLFSVWGLTLVSTWVDAVDLLNRMMQLAVYMASFVFTCMMIIQMCKKHGWLGFTKTYRKPDPPTEY